MDNISILEQQYRTDHVTEPALTTKELQKWNIKLEKTQQKTFRYPDGIKLNLTDSEKRRWVRSRIRKENPQIIPEVRLENCRTLLKAGCSVINIHKVMKVGDTKIRELKQEMQNNHINRN